MTSADRLSLLRLANVKVTYEHALRLLENPTALDGAISLVLLDNSIEAIFKIALDRSESKVKEDPKFPELLRCVLSIESLSELEKHKLSLSALHRARNGFQHHGVIPDLNTVQNEYGPLTEQVLDEVSSTEFGLKWKDVSLSLLIRDETVSMLYKKAEESFKKDDFAGAAACLIYAFELTKWVAKLRIFGSGLSSQRLKIRGGFGRDKVVVDYLTTLDEEIETFKLGLNYMDLRNYLDIAQNVGIDSILYEMPLNVTEETVIAGFKKKLHETSVDPESLKEWYVKMADPILKFIVRTESNSRFSTDQFNKLTKAAISGLGDVFEKFSQSARKAR